MPAAVFEVKQVFQGVFEPVAALQGSPPTRPGNGQKERQNCGADRDSCDKRPHFDYP